MSHVIARAASVPCDGLTPRRCTALRALMSRAQAEHEQQQEAYIRYAADFALWVATVEDVADGARLLTSLEGHWPRRDRQLMGPRTRALYEDVQAG